MLPLPSNDGQKLVGGLEPDFARRFTDRRRHLDGPNVDRRLQALLLVGGLHFDLVTLADICLRMLDLRTVVLRRRFNRT